MTLIVTKLMVRQAGHRLIVMIIVGVGRGSRTECKVKMVLMMRLHRRSVIVIGEGDCDKDDGCDGWEANCYDNDGGERSEMSIYRVIVIAVRRLQQGDCNGDCVIVMVIVIGRMIVIGRNRVEEGNCTGYNDCTITKHER